MSNMPKVTNKQPAPMQITAEQILREARERQEDEPYTAPAQKVMDPEELAVYRMKERKQYEDRLRMNRFSIGTRSRRGIEGDRGISTLPFADQGKGLL